MEDKPDLKTRVDAQKILEASFIISVSRTPDDGNSRIKVIRSKFTPASKKEK